MIKTIAVLMASYNGEKYISEQIQSILNQKINGWKLYLYIRDDGSSDGTKRILQSFCEYNNNIIILCGKHKGVVEGFFELMELARKGNYDYYALSDQDDIWDLDKLEIAVNTIDAQKKSVKIPCLYTGSSRLVNNDLKEISNGAVIYRPITFYNTIIQNCSAGHTYVFNRILLDVSLDMVDAKKIYMHDSYLLNTAVICGEIYYDPMPHVSYRQHSDNVLGERADLFGWIIERIKRIKRGDAKKYAEQIEYICQRYQVKMREEEVLEMKAFLESRNSVIKRMRYISKTRLYRQERIGDLFFRLLYLIGGYN